MEKIILLVFLLSALTLTSCHEDSFFEGKTFVGGVTATAEQLNSGKRIYAESCMACHGVNGDGKGVAAKGLYPVPRNFKLGIFKFADVPAGELPHDASLKRTILHGLEGTAMLKWSLSDKQTNNVIQYIKTFAPEVWESKDSKLGKVIKLTKDPFGLAHKTSAEELGKQVFHIQGECHTCHRAYATKDYIKREYKKINEEDFSDEDFDEQMYTLKPQETEHGDTILPPDFTWHRIRSAATYKEIAYRIAAGVGGTTMPTWKETITDREIWAAAYYVKSLVDLKDTKERNEFVSKFKF